MPVLNKVSIWSLEYLFNDTASGKKHPKIAGYKAKDSCIFWYLKLGWSILRYLEVILPDLTKKTNKNKLPARWAQKPAKSAVK